MFDRKSNYSINKQDPDAIVYPAQGEHIRLTREDFDTEADFLKWKAWSDADYHSEERREHIHANHTDPMDKLSVETGSAPSPEIIIEQRMERAEHDRATVELVVRVKGQLTDKQFRRLWLNAVDGLTEATIAEMEGKTQQGISKSIRAGKEKLKKFCCKPEKGL